MIAFTEIWCSDDKADKIWNSIQKGGGIALYFHNGLNIKIPKNKNINNNDIECLMLEL